MLGGFRSCWFALSSVFLVVAEPKIFVDNTVGVIDFLAATAELQVDFNADIVNGHSLQAQTKDLGVTGFSLDRSEPEARSPDFFP